MVVARTPRRDGCAGGADRRARGHAPVPRAGASRRGRAPRTRHVDAPIGRDPRNRLRMAVVDLQRHPGKPARTLIERAGHADAGLRWCAARWRPGAPTRSACTWPRSAIRWWATRSTAGRRRRPGAAGAACLPARLRASRHAASRMEFQLAAAARSGAGYAGLGAGLQSRLTAPRAAPAHPMPASRRNRLRAGSACLPSF